MGSNSSSSKAKLEVCHVTYLLIHHFGAAQSCSLGAVSAPESGRLRHVVSAHSVERQFRHQLLLHPPSVS